MNGGCEEGKMTCEKRIPPQMLPTDIIRVDFPKLCEESVLEEGVPDEDRDYQSFASVLVCVCAILYTLQVCLDSGAKKVLLPIASAVDLGSVPAKLIGCFNLIFYNSVEDAVFKALGVE